jgi:hypothetical protein
MSNALKKIERTLKNKKNCSEINGHSEKKTLRKFMATKSITVWHSSTTHRAPETQTLFHIETQTDTQ